MAHHRTSWPVFHDLRSQIPIVQMSLSQVHCSVCLGLIVAGAMLVSAFSLAALSVHQSPPGPASQPHHLQQAKLSRAFRVFFLLFVFVGYARLPGHPCRLTYVVVAHVERCGIQGSSGRDGPAGVVRKTPRWREWMPRCQIDGGPRLTPSTDTAGRNSARLSRPDRLLHVPTSRPN